MEGWLADGRMLKIFEGYIIIPRHFFVAGHKDCSSYQTVEKKIFGTLCFCLSINGMSKIKGGCESVPVAFKSVVKLLG